MSFREFPIDVFPDPFQQYIREHVRSYDVDTSFMILPMLSVIAAAIGNSRTLKIDQKWFEPSIIWTVVVGESGTGKTHSAKAFIDFAQAQEDMADERYEQEMKKYRLAEYVRKKSRDEAAKGEEIAEPEEPVMRRYKIVDITIEALAEVLRDNPRGVLLFNDELRAWFSSFGLYRQGKGAGGDAVKWGEIWNRNSIAINRKSSGAKTIKVKHPNVSVTGGIQSEILRKCMQDEYKEAGLAARLLFAWPPDDRDQPYQTLNIPYDLDETIKSAFQWLYSLDGDNGGSFVEMTPEAQKLFIKFRDLMTAKSRQERTKGRKALAAAMAKLVSYCGRFALVLHMMRMALERNTDQSRKIDVATVDNAVRMVGWFLNEYRRIEKLFCDSEEDQTLRKVLEKMESQGGEITVKELQTSYRKSLGNAQEIRAYMEQLEEDGYVRSVDDRKYQITDDAKEFLAG